jgi:hypothetical protein
MEAAKRSSVNIPTGALETKSLISVNKETIRTCFLEKVMFSIKEKWTTEERGQPKLLSRIVQKYISVVMMQNLVE